MITILSNDSHDIALSPGGNVTIANGITAIAQTAQQYMLARRLEMVLAIDRGIPFDPVAWGSSPNIAQFEAAGRATLMEVPDVIEVLEFTASLVGDVLGYTATMRTTEGEITVNG